MFGLIKEGCTAVRLAYYQLALRQMHPLHKDYPAVLLHVLALREYLKSIRGFSS